MNLDGKVTNPGELRTKITLQSRTVTQDAGRFSVPRWITIAAVWSKWINAHGNAVLQAGIEGVEAPATVLIRYRSGIDATCSVLKSGMRYEIISEPDNIQERNEYLELKVRRMKAG